MSKKSDKGVTVRIKQKFAEYIESIAEEREESFLDALYHVIDTYRRTRLTGDTSYKPSKSQVITQQSNTSEKSLTGKQPVTIDDSDVDFDDFV